MRIATTLWLCIGAVAVGYLATVSLDVALGVRNQDVLRRVAAIDHPAAIRCQRASSAFDLGVRASESAVVFGDQTEFANSQERYRLAIAELESTAALPGLDPARRQAMQRLRDDIGAFATRAAAVYGPMSDGRSTPELQAAANALSRERMALRTALAGEVEAFTAQLRGGIGAAVDSAQDQRHIVLVVFVAVVLTTLTATAVVMSRLSRRLAGLVAASDRLAQGDYGAGLPESSGDELGRLTGSFATMREAVQARDRELRAFGEGLEHTVESRTRELAVRNARLSEEIAERERAERSLRLLESAVGQISEGVVVAACGDGGHRVIYVNQGFCALNRIPAADAVGIDLADLGADAGDRIAIAGLLAAAGRGEDAVGQVACRRPDGGPFPAEWHVAPVRIAAGAVDHLVAIQRDVTERRRVEAALAEAHQRTIDASREAGKAEVATSVLHNVGNVLNSVNVSIGVVGDRLAASRVANLGRAAALLEERSVDLAAFLSGDERGRLLPRYLADLGRHLEDEHRQQVEEVRALGRFVEHIKDVIALQQGYARAAGLRQPDTARGLCEDALRVHLAQVEAQGVRIERAYGSEQRLLLDRSRVLQVLINLVGNARHALAGAPEPRLAVTAAVAGGRLAITVADNGCGIAPGHMPRLFTHGFTTRPDGHGFGLHASALAAREMGGSLTAHSDGPGRGASFTLDIPAEPAP